MRNKYVNRVIVSVLCGFIVVDILLVYLALTISPIQLKRDCFTFQYGEDIATNVDYYVNANQSVLENVKLDLSHVSQEVGKYQASIEYFGKKESFEIEVIDTVKPRFQLKQIQFNVRLGQTIKAVDLIKEVEDLSNTTVYFYDENTGEKTLYKSFDMEGSYIERIIVEDDHGNQSSALRVKIVVEENNVVPQIKGANDCVIHVGDEFDLRKGVKAYDDLEGDITDRIIIEGYVDNNQSGEYQVVYRVLDNQGNMAKVVRKVTVEENDN